MLKDVGLSSKRKMILAGVLVPLALLAGFFSDEIAPRGTGGYIWLKVAIAVVFVALYALLGGLRRTESKGVAPGSKTDFADDKS
ncbi:MAG: hypothetical protein ABW224_15545 [Kibdelosporangium sp.]